MGHTRAAAIRVFVRCIQDLDYSSGVPACPLSAGASGR